MTNTIFIATFYFEDALSDMRRSDIQQLIHKEYQVCTSYEDAIAMMLGYVNDGLEEDDEEFATRDQLTETSIDEIESTHTGPALQPVQATSIYHEDTGLTGMIRQFPVA